MKSYKINVLTIVLGLAAIAGTSFAQGPLHKRINYNIDAPFELKNSNVVMPAGDYVIYQISAENPNLFGIYRNDLRDVPVAIVHTVRIDYQAKGYPQNTRILLSKDNEDLRSRDIPVVKGFHINGYDGWEIVGVVTNRDQIMSMIR